MNVIPRIEVSRSDRSGFTLIELLIVVAIIGILAAIAVPNFINAQLKAKVTRAYSDMGALAMALDMYFLDNNKFPTSNYKMSYPDRPFVRLTTPIAFIASFPTDPFRSSDKVKEHSLYGTSGPDYTYYMCSDTPVYSGPNTPGESQYLMSFDWFMISPGPAPQEVWIFYDLSNGVSSQGYIYRSNNKEETNSKGGGFDHRPR